MGSEKSILNARLGGWRPNDTGDTRLWLANLIKEVDEKPEPLNDTLREFKELIESDTMIFLLFQYMFVEIPNREPYNCDPTRQFKQVRDYKHMLDLFNKVMQKAPKWLYKTEDQQLLIALPITAILDWPMGTASGQAAFLHPEVNKQFCKMLTEWGKFLTDKASRDVLVPDREGWLSDEALHVMAQVVWRASPVFADKPFEKLFKCDSHKPHYGFKSWDDFFTRHFCKGVRPVDDPDDAAVVVNACESATLDIYHNVKRCDKFWVKDQPYSLDEMLAGHKYAKVFAGGTIYQAFLSALSYHRWHSPVSGTVVAVHHQPGTYYAESHWEGFRLPSEYPPNDEPDTDGKPHTDKPQPDGEPQPDGKLEPDDKPQPDGETQPDGKLEPDGKTNPDGKPGDKPQPDGKTNLDGKLDDKPYQDDKPDDRRPNPGGFENSQRFMAHVATRAMIYIQADNPDIGLMCIMPVGMVEVSSCEVTVRKGQRINKGDQLGTFHFGGSTHCLFFQRGVNINFIPKGPFPQKNNNAVCSALAVVGKHKSPDGIGLYQVGVLNIYSSTYIIDDLNHPLLDSTKGIVGE